MPMERRGRQNLNLATGTQTALSGGENEHKEDQAHRGLLPNRWARIGLAAQDRQLVFSNLMTHVNEDSFREAFKAIDGSKALGVDGITYKLKQILKSPVREIRMRGSVRVLPFNLLNWIGR